jgi:hypothetical protein
MMEDGRGAGAGRRCRKTKAEGKGERMLDGGAETVNYSVVRTVGVRGRVDESH